MCEDGEEVVGGGKHACKGHAVSSSSMGMLLMLLLFATVVSSGDVDGLSDVEGGEALPQSHAASSLLQYRSDVLYIFDVS